MQILENLVSNAVKYAGADAAISLTAYTDGAAVVIEVADTGSGIPADEVDRLFDRHYRARSARGSDVPGAGLGLPIAKSLAEAMGGSLSVRSTLGAGTTFAVRLRRVGDSSTNVLGRRQRKLDDYGSDLTSRRTDGEQRQGR
jgi:signal transduction histidine kinase